MEQRTPDELWAEAERLETIGRQAPLVVGSVGQRVLNRALRQAHGLRAEARKIEGRPAGRGDTVVCAASAAAADLDGLAALLETSECASASRHASRIRHHVTLVTATIRPRPVHAKTMGAP